MTITLCQGTHERSQMICLLQGTLTDLHDVGKVSKDLGKKLSSDDSFSEEQSMKRVGVVRVLFGNSMETL